MNADGSNVVDGYADDATIRRILEGTGDTWAVVGLSNNS
ncbi:CoA-binding protein, partial [Streptomyces sp. SID7982]|nr:CoA-binding protein [Streptomyces sp. SID7982]